MIGDGKVRLREREREEEENREEERRREMMETFNTVCVYDLTSI